MELLLQSVINGFVDGFGYFLMAVGLTLVFGIVALALLTEMRDSKREWLISWSG